MPSPITRRSSTAVKVGAVTIGGDAPIVVQSMTNTDTAKTLVQATSEAAGHDVFANEFAVILPGNRRAVSTGFTA